MDDDKYLQEILKDLKKVPRLNKLMSGAGFFDKLRKAYKTISTPAKVVAALAGQPEIALALEGADVLANGRRYTAGSCNNMIGSSKKSHSDSILVRIKERIKKKEAKKVGSGKGRTASKSTLARRALVKKIMKEKKMSLPEASKYIKLENLWKK